MYIIVPYTYTYTLYNSNLYLGCVSLLACLIKEGIKCDFQEHFMGMSVPSVCLSVRPVITLERVNINFSGFH